MIPPRLSVVTVGARDFAALRAFYVGLGWTPEIDLDDFAAFPTGGAIFTLYPLRQLAADARLKPEDTIGAFRGPTLAINVERFEDVDATIEAARAAGATITSEPRTMEFGVRSAYFSDPEGNVWEVAAVPPESEMAKLLARARG